MRSVFVRIPITAWIVIILRWRVDVDVVGAESTAGGGWSRQRSFVPSAAPNVHRNVTLESMRGSTSDTRPTLIPTGIDATTVANDAVTNRVESDSSNPTVAAAHAESVPTDDVLETAKSNRFAAISVLVLSHVDNSLPGMVLLPSRLGCIVALADESIRLWHGPYQALLDNAPSLPLWQAQALLSDVLILVLHVNDAALAASQKLVPAHLSTSLVHGLEQRMAAGLSKGRLLVLGLWHPTNDSTATKSATGTLSESAQQLWRERLVLDELRGMTPDILERLDLELMVVDQARQYNASAFISGILEVMGQPNGLHSIVDGDCVVALLKQTYLCLGGHDDETLIFSNAQTVDSVELSQYIERSIDSAQEAERSVHVDSVEPSQYLERSVDSAQEAERSAESAREADRSVDSAQETEQSVDSTQEAERSVEYTQEAERSVNSAQYIERIVDSAPEAERSAESAPEAERSVESAPEAERSVESAPEAERSAESAPEAERSVNSVQEAERTVNSAQEAEPNVESAEEAERSVESSEEAERGVDSAQEAERSVLHVESLDFAQEMDDIDAIHIESIGPDEQLPVDGAEIANPSNGSNVSMPNEYLITLHERLHATPVVPWKVGSIAFRQRIAQRLGHIREVLRRRGTNDNPSISSAPLPDDIDDGAQAQNTGTLMSTDQVTSNLPEKVTWNIFRNRIAQRLKHLREKVDKRGSKQAPSNTTAPLPDDNGDEAQAQNTLISLDLLGDNLVNSDGLPIDFSLRLQQILNEFGWTEARNIPVNVQDRVFDVHRQYLDQLRDHFGRVYEALLENSDPKSWRAVRERLVGNFWQSVQTSRPFPASALLPKSDTSCQNALAGLESDMDYAAVLRKEPYEGDDEEQNDIDNPSLAQRKRFMKWCKKMAAKGVMLGVNYLQGWLAWQALQRAALEREREFPKFPLF
jgi:hypothetical protein